MHRKVALISVLALAAGSAALLPVSGAQAGVQVRPEPAQKAAADSASERRQVLTYWTERRMEAAPPLDAPGPKAGAKKAMAQPAEGTPWTAPPSGASKSRAALQAARSSGTPWTKGGAVVKTTGRVFFTTQGRNASCSGSAVTSANKSVVLTAGHCVKMGGAFHTNWVFVPGYDNGRRPFGTWAATRLLTTPQWNAREDINFDIAAAVIAPLEGKTLVDVVGGQGVAFNQPRRQQMYAFGYPAAAPYDGSKLIHCSGRAFDDVALSKDHGLTCNMTGGSSGGPWMLNFNESTGLGTQNSVNSFKYNFAPNWMFGPYFGNEAQAVYQAAQNTNAV
ncbi:peptidase [Nonomuraea sp. KC401]|uniref:trypsin-like serine peptidase n=1 Tax=unclassified Nonomuraea TaxID=2593643 RepID=UPI0010FECA88|nr:MULTISPECIES: peptidase [unclassified Nonomuraea]NBE97423.1 peptidase [Nonomuraea sp. K271]TLF64872.1 peptidase [Nonomuraea sp. KC401]